MQKLFLLEGEAKSETLEVLTSYIMPTLKAKAQVIILSPKEKTLLHLDTLPVLVHDDTTVTDLEKIVYTVCKLAGVDGMILKEAELWSTSKAFAFDRALQGPALLDKLNSMLVSKTFLCAVHITLVDIVTAVPAIRALKEHPVEKQLGWLNVYRWAEYLLNLPYLGNILLGKGCSLQSLSLLVKPKEEEKGEGKKGKKDKKVPKEPKEKKPKEPEVPPFGQLDIRVGKVLKAEKHPKSEKLYTEEVDIGGEVRKIASGLQQFVKLEDFIGKNVVVFCNLKVKTMVDYPSHGMVLCASDAEHKTVELLSPPEGAKPGDVVTVEGIARSPAADLNLSRKNNPWAKLEHKLKTDTDLVVKLEGKPLRTDKGAVTVKSLKAAEIC